MRGTYVSINLNEGLRIVGEDLSMGPINRGMTLEPLKVEKRGKNKSINGQSKRSKRR